jgi:hypothetical protein
MDNGKLQSKALAPLLVEHTTMVDLIPKLKGEVLR